MCFFTKLKNEIIVHKVNSTGSLLERACKTGFISCYEFPCLVEITTASCYSNFVLIDQVLKLTTNYWQMQLDAEGISFMKKKLLISAIIIIVAIAAVAYLSQPKAMINEQNSYDIHYVVYKGVDVTERVDCKKLASIVSKYSCSRLPHRFTSYQRSRVVVELNGINEDHFLQILLGDINIAYGSRNQSAFSIRNSAALLNEILELMPALTDEERGLEEKNVMTLSDGESVDLWRSVYSSRDNIYKLSDETTLLSIQATAGPDNVYVGGLESFDDLSETAQKGVTAYYEEQGLLYNIPAELEKAYAEYLSCKENGTEYHERSISQDIAPTASNDKIMCFLTSVMLPVSGNTVQEIRLGAAFDRETGDALNIGDLFAKPEAEVRQVLLDLLAPNNPALRNEMEAALKPEYIILFPDYLQVAFPQGTLPSKEYCLFSDFDYDELRNLLQPWTIPNERLS